MKQCKETEHSTVWIVEFQTEDQPGQWFVHDVTLYAPERERMVSNLADKESVTGIRAREFKIAEEENRCSE